jgi:hypothetical protein
MFRSSLTLSAGMLFAALALSDESAFAQEDTKSANYVMTGCHSLVADQNIEPFLQGICAGLISGVTYQSKDNCLPVGVTRAQIVRVVVQYIGVRPARMHEDFRKLALEALRAAWPCEKLASPSK